MIITDLALFNFEDGQLTLKEIMPGATLEEVRSKTEATFRERLK
jgi:3-oxoacid CoA-transferase